MKRKVTLIVLIALSALLCGCQNPDPAETEVPAVTEISVSEPADCCGGEIPDCCKEKEESEPDCCKNSEESEADCCKNSEESEADCCKAESESDCCKQNQS